MYPYPGEVCSWVQQYWHLSPSFLLFLQGECDRSLRSHQLSLSLALKDAIAIKSEFSHLKAAVQRYVSVWDCLLSKWERVKNYPFIHNWLQKQLFKSLQNSCHMSPLVWPTLLLTSRELGVAGREMDVMLEQVRQRVQQEVTFEHAVKGKMAAVLQQKDWECGKVKKWEGLQDFC